ncbi:cyclic GMP-AMP synthase [Poecilia latipinna]|uniref:cyclic GMP-AMP synthase n=1 Tax=Poecilia latipinna TaxID=48699 RepID=UPI00072EE667|nr:PREDICTED: cyclic GMP-AMP synthase-like [Poecilia latipinna]XP_014895202.1 PREDICTED: cyclic GMP-AMP synthase-like [Poecilia latipinna]XP_014895203.1 PREDICTED: cyclic GMP-AMP synthase-like [Poecilia latipinna]
MDTEDNQPEVVSPVRRRPRVQPQDSVESSLSVEEPLPIPPHLAHWIKLRAKELKIRQKDRSWAAELVNDFRENLLRFLKNSSDQPLFQSADFLTTGSYFEKVKIYIPDEFDMMLKLPVPSRFSTTKLDAGLFYRIDLTRPTRTPIKDFLLDDRLTLSSSKILTEMFRLVRKFLKTYRVPDHRCRWELNRKKPNSPAVTLSLCRRDSGGEELISVDVVPALEVQSWPPAVRNGPDVDRWLGTKLRQEIRSLPCYFVPKRQKGRKLSEDAKESWRISFSHIEKKIITSHGNKKTCCESRGTKCCRKQCLMLLKSLIEGLKRRYPKELEDLCSYHGKTAFLHTLSTRYNDSSWAPQHLPTCFLQLVAALQDYARTGSLPHFFVPESNLFATSVFPRRAQEFLVKVLEEQMKEGLPLLRPPPLLPSLKPVTVRTEMNPEELPEKSHPLISSDWLKLILVFVVAVVFGFKFLCF